MFSLLILYLCVAGLLLLFTFISVVRLFDFFIILIFLSLIFIVSTSASNYVERLRPQDNMLCVEQDLVFY